MKTVIVKIANTYADDAFSRDLEIGEDIARNKRFTTIRANREQLEELWSDANYYRTEVKYMDSYLRPIGRSAAAALPKIEAALREVAK